MDASQYLERIGFTSSTEPTRETLDALIERHQATVPFENIDIVRLRRPIALDRRRLFEKIVGERRGGFCFELNGLFAELLTSLGFGVTRGYGVWPNRDGEWTVPFDHLVLAVDVPDSDDRLLADVGFGANCPAVAVPLDGGLIRNVGPTASEAYRAIPISDDPERWRIEQKRSDADWALIYEVDLTPREIAAFAERCAYLQSSPDSVFTQGLICSRPLETGRVTLGGGTFILTTHGDRDERPLMGTGDELELLRDWFGIEIEPTRYGVER